MKVHLIERAIREFMEDQIKSPSDAWYFPHAITGHFHTRWFEDPAESLLAKYDQSLRSDISQRWWKRDTYRPKEIMLLLIQADPELAGIAWKDLQQEKANLEGRLSRFNYYCEQLLQLHRDKHPRAIETYHHQDASMMSLYLAGLFPEKYSLYPGLEVFQTFCRAIGSPDIPKVDDLVRYMKVASIVHTYLLKSELYPQLLQQRDFEMHKIRCIPMILSYEVIMYTASHSQTFSK